MPPASKLASFNQSPTEPDFVQNPYVFYDETRATGPFFYWQDYGLTCTTSHSAISTLLRDRRLGREAPAHLRTLVAPHTKPFYDIEAHSMLELESPVHSRLRGLVLRAFTSRRIVSLQPEIAALSHQLAATLPKKGFDLLPHFAQKLPVIIIARLLGVPEEMAPQLLTWSRAMVGMYMANRNHERELAAAQAAAEFSDFLQIYLKNRAASPKDDLISHLIAAEQEGQRLSEAEMISTCILLLNAGHEATVHSIGNGVKAILESPGSTNALAPDHIEVLVEEILRYDPALHMFTRYAYEDVEIMGNVIPKNSQIGLLLGAANRDPNTYERPHFFAPHRVSKAHTTFGAGVHFCLGAPLARLEMQIALPILFEHHPHLNFAVPPKYADVYHFHGLESLMLQPGL
ncbi:MAG: cytochrome P450 [Paracoccaceae bacterium]